jgi:hypothetical protein
MLGACKFSTRYAQKRKTGKMKQRRKEEGGGKESRERRGNYVVFFFGVISCLAYP